jgi:hypothetical protein
MSDYYKELLNRIGIDPGFAELEDLVKLAVPSVLSKGRGF